MLKLPTVLFENENGIATITMNIPEKGNPVSGNSLSNDIEYCIDECAADQSVRVVILRGAGKNFSVGGDINWMKDALDSGKEIDYEPILKGWQGVLTKFKTLRKPIIASIQGAAAGGGLGLALACDFRIATEKSKFVAAQTNIGLVPDMGCAYNLVQMVGASKALELMITGKIITGQEALDLGIVSQAVPVEQLESATMELANKLAKGHTVAYGALKAMVYSISYGGYAMNFQNEVEFIEKCSKTEDHQESVEAFLEKRLPVLTGK
ncbi:enoyl-CoA hydratase/isomerase family protein [Bacillus sp. B15-48]|uniref:enoyl-CoA hydratase/isomerase family protein n=1 Tax=Bacillus sp. B15-48 TaxID=1548601 RepID=UPI00193F24CD|nr:enoyl-CoA hydratase/isomerase family protein [Bacillus sp. B15-48]MBM4764280.1 enoyl-CoA hydratase [Bacillus sp. B15-48]